MSSHEIRSGYLDLTHGQLHVRGILDDSTGLPPMLLLHQNPLSLVTYERVLVGMSEYCRPIAVDTPGFGMSASAGRGLSIEEYTRIIAEASRALNLENPYLLGQHTGALIAVEACAAELIDSRGLILIGLPCFTSSEASERLASKRVFKVAESGAHLQFLWERMNRQYPGIDPHLATRHIADHLLAGPEAYLDVYRAVYTYPLLDRLPLLDERRILLLSGSGDCIKDVHDRSSEYLPNASAVTMESLTDFAMDEDPEVFTAAIRDFVEA